ncbi:hypothetical protein WA158_001068 [Blastocystis sp. Blastoise]
MEAFLTAIQFCEPGNVCDIKVSEEQQQLLTVEGFETMTLTTFNENCVWGLKHCYKLKCLKLTGLVRADFTDFVNWFTEIQEHWSSIDPNAGLETLEIRSCNICPKTMEDLMNLFNTNVFTHLKSFTLENEPSMSMKSFIPGLLSNHWTLFTQALRNHCCPHLDQICLPNCTIGSTGLAELCTVYKENKDMNIRTLQLRNCDIGTSGIEAFCQFCQEQPIDCTLEHLDFSHNRLKTKGFIALGDLFRKMKFPCLKSLNISYNPGRYKAVDYFLEALEFQCCEFLENLCLDYLSIAPEGFQCIGHAIRNNCLSHLRELSLNNCALTGEGLEHVCSAIQDCNCNSLESFSICDNRLSFRECQSLFDCIECGKMNMIRVCLLNGNKLTDKGLSLLLEACHRGGWETLQLLSLNRCKLTTNGLTQLYEDLNANLFPKLIELHLDGNKINDILTVQFRSLFEKNSPLDIIYMDKNTKRRPAPSIHDVDIQPLIQEIPLEPVTPIELEKTPLFTPMDERIVETDKVANVMDDLYENQGEPPERYTQQEQITDTNNIEQQSYPTTPELTPSPVPTHKVETEIQEMTKEIQKEQVQTQQKKSMSYSESYSTEPSLEVPENQENPEEYRSFDNSPTEHPEELQQKQGTTTTMNMEDIEKNPRNSQEKETTNKIQYVQGPVPMGRYQNIEPKSPAASA